jgi:hypothetical protein
LPPLLTRTPARPEHRSGAQTPPFIVRQKFC